MRRIAAVCAAFALTSSASAQVHPLVGKWQWTGDSNNCTEVYDYRADGSLHVVSGQEITDSSYEVTPKPDANGFYRVTGKTLKSNGGRDCSQTQSDDVGKPYTIYVIFHPIQPVHLVCDTAELKACYGPLRRIEP